MCGHFAVSPRFFATTEIPLLRGRGFTTSDNADSVPVAIVNEAFARRYFPGENPIGRHIRIDPAHRAGEQWSEIVGIAGNVNNTSAKRSRALKSSSRFSLTRRAPCI